MVVEHSSGNAASSREGTLRNILAGLLFVQVGGMFFSIALSSIAFGGAVFAYIGLVFAAKNKRTVLVKTGLEWYIVAYVVAVFVMVMFAIYPDASLHSARRILLISVLYFIPAALPEKRDMVRFILLLAIVIGIQSTIEFIFYLTGNVDRINVFQHYMTAGGMKMVVLLVIIPLLFIEDLPRWYRAVFVGSSTIAVVTLVLTQTRSSWLGFIAGFLLIAVLQYRKLFYAIPVAIVLFLLLAPTEVRERVTDMVKMDKTEAKDNATVASNMNRIRMWKTGLYIFTQYPVTGVGDGEVWHIYRRYVTPDDPDEGGHFHNTYIHVLATHGILGFVAMMLLFGAIVLLEWRTWKHARDETGRALGIGALAAFLGFAVNGMAEYNFGDHEVLVLLWLTVGIAVANRRSEYGATS